jgi:hypothetical protein
MTIISKATFEASKRKFELATVAWDATERILYPTEHADILVIFDCCDAGSLCKGRAPTRFEYLAACHAGARTKPAGPKSFTRALIWSLKQLKSHKRGWYSTSELRDKVYTAPNFPKEQNPTIGQRFYPGDYIVLAPSTRVLTPGALRRRESIEEQKRPPIRREYLDLRFEFHESVTDEVVKETGRVLRSLIKESKIKATRTHFIEKRGGSRWPPILTVVQAAVRLRKRQARGGCHSRSSSTGIAVQVAPLASLLNSQMAASASSLSPPPGLSYASSKLACPPAVEGVTANGLFAYAVPRLPLADIASAFVRS